MYLISSVGILLCFQCVYSSVEGLNAVINNRSLLNSSNVEQYLDAQHELFEEQKNSIIPRFGYQAQPNIENYGYQVRPNTGNYGYQTRPNTGNYGYQTRPNTGNYGYQTRPNTGNYVYQVRPNTGNYGYQARPNTGNYGYQARPNTGNYGYQTRPNTGNYGYQTRPNTGNYGYQVRPNTGKYGYQTRPNTGNYVYQAHPNTGNYGYLELQNTGNRGYEDQLFENAREEVSVIENRVDFMVGSANMLTAKLGYCKMIVDVDNLKKLAVKLFDADVSRRFQNRLDNIFLKLGALDYKMQEKLGTPGLLRKSGGQDVIV